MELYMYIQWYLIGVSNPKIECYNARIALKFGLRDKKNPVNYL